MKQVPTFIKPLKEYFSNIKTKGYEEGKVYTKFLIMHSVELEDLIEMIKKDMKEFRLYIKRQAVLHHSTETTKWCIKLHPEIHLQSI